MLTAQLFLTVLPSAAHEQYMNRARHKSSGVLLDTHT